MLFSIIPYTRYRETYLNNLKFQKSKTLYFNNQNRLMAIFEGNNIVPCGYSMYENIHYTFILNTGY